MTNLAAHRARNPPHPAALAGGVAVSRLRVYDALAPDGWAGGSPHMHLACAEAYVVLGGVGSVELLSLVTGASASSFARETQCSSIPESFIASSTTETSRSSS